MLNIHSNLKQSVSSAMKGLVLWGAMSGFAHSAEISTQTDTVNAPVEVISMTQNGADTATVNTVTENQATEKTVTENQATEKTVTENQATVNAVQQFVKGDFDVRSQLLTTWTGTPVELKQMINALKADQLYTDANGNVYRLTNDTELSDYFTEIKVTEFPPSLDKVTLDNSLQTLVNILEAKVGLASKDPSVRLKATQTMGEAIAQDPATVDDALISSALASEKDPQIKTLLQNIQYQKDLASSDTARQLSAAKGFGESSDPAIKVLIDQKLQDSSISPELKKALETSSASIDRKLKLSEWTGYLFSGLSMASILLLAALGLAITYGLLGVINMAHGELIMIGAYTTYVVQGLCNTYFPNYADGYLLVAIPSAFLVSAMIGMIIERVVIRPLYGRQLETLLATFGVSLILMQLVRMIFGAQNVEVSNASWMSGGWVISESLTLPYSRIAIIGFTIAVLIGLKWLISGTRFGLFVRAVTQNRQMARAIGVRSARIDMLAFGLGSGLAGLAGCALSQIGNVGPDLGQTYIIDAFLVVVVGGVGQLAGAMLAALGLGIGGKFLEVGMGAVLAKICLLVLIILFIQKRPQGLFSVKGRFVD